jgi:hypothetical protein
VAGGIPLNTDSEIQICEKKIYWGIIQRSAVMGITGGRSGHTSTEIHLQQHFNFDSDKYSRTGKTLEIFPK